MKECDYDKINVFQVDDECLTIQCICGYGKNPWEFVISIYEDFPEKCPECGRKYYFSNSIRVYVDEKECLNV